MTAQLPPPSVTRFFDNNGFPLFLGKLTTYAAGSTTPQATYVDSSQTTQNTNPIILNFRGECQLWLDPTKAYKFLLQDALGNTIPGWPVDNITIGNANPSFNIIPTVDNLFTLGNASFSWANVFVGANHVPILDTASGNIGYYARTAAEIAAGVIPSAFIYPELDVKRYGAVGDGLTDDSIAFTNAGLVARVNGGEIFVSKPAVQYLLTNTVNWTNGNTVNPQHGFCVRGCAGGYDNATSAHILIKHTGYGFDCAGTNSIRFLNLVIATDAVTYPKVIFFRARNSVGNSQVYRFTNIMFVGSASISVDYNYASEQDVHVGCLWYNNAADANAKVHIITANNSRALTSSFITIATGNRSCITHRYYGGDYFINSTSATADVFELENCLEVFIDGCWLDSRGRSYIYVNPANGTSSFIRVDKIEGENSAPLPTYGIYFGPAGSTQTPSGWQINDSYIPSVTRMLFADTNIVLDNFYVDNIQENASHGLQATTLQNSIIDSTGLVLSLGTSKQNRLTGDSSGWTITTRSNDFWDDTGAVKKTWTPVTTSMGATGAVTVNEAHALFHGSLVTLTLTCSAATSIISTAGTNFVSGIPISCSNRSAIVSVCNESTHVPIGTGMVDTDNKIWLPTINVGAGIPITITATYFAA